MVLTRKLAVVAVKCLTKVSRKCGLKRTISLAFDRLRQGITGQWDKCEDAFFSANERSKGEGKGKAEERKGRGGKWERERRRGKGNWKWSFGRNGKNRKRGPGFDSRLGRLRFFPFLPKLHFQFPFPFLLSLSHFPPLPFRSSSFPFPSPFERPFVCAEKLVVSGKNSGRWSWSPYMQVVAWYSAFELKTPCMKKQSLKAGGRLNWWSLKAGLLFFRLPRRVMLFTSTRAAVGWRTSVEQHSALMNRSNSMSLLHCWRIHWRWRRKTQIPSAHAQGCIPQNKKPAKPWRFEVVVRVRNTEQLKLPEAGAVYQKRITTTLQSERTYQ